MRRYCRSTPAHNTVTVDGEEIRLTMREFELLWYLREQSISFDYHRYGTLGDRATEERAATL